MEQNRELHENDIVRLTPDQCFYESDKTDLYRVLEVYGNGRIRVEILTTKMFFRSQYVYEEEWVRPAGITYEELMAIGAELKAKEQNAR